MFLDCRARSAPLRECELCRPLSPAFVVGNGAEIVAPVLYHGIRREEPRSCGCSAYAIL